MRDSRSTTAIAGGAADERVGAEEERAEDGGERLDGYGDGGRGGRIRLLGPEVVGDDLAVLACAHGD